MNIKYLNISQVARDVAFLMRKKEGVSIKEIEKKFGKRYARKGLNELTNQDPKLVIYDKEKGIYKVSKKLEAEIRLWENYVRILV
jgi:tricorn protease-like protein